MYPVYMCSYTCTDYYVNIMKMEHTHVVSLIIDNIRSSSRTKICLCKEKDTYTCINNLQIRVNDIA